MNRTVIKDFGGDTLYINPRTDHGTVAVMLSTNGGASVYLTPEQVKTLQEALSEAVSAFEEAHRVLTTYEQIKVLEPGVSFRLTHNQLPDDSGYKWIRVSGGIVSLSGGAYYHDNPNGDFDQEPYAEWVNAYAIDITERVNV